MTDVKNPVQLERDLEALRIANQEATRWLMQMEGQYEAVQAQYAIALEKARLSTWRLEDQTGWTETRRNAFAVTECEMERLQLAGTSSELKAAKAKVNGIRAEIDILRSQSALMRSAMEMV